MHIGYIKHKGTKLSKLGEIYIDALKNYENKVYKCKIVKNELN